MVASDNLFIHIWLRPDDHNNHFVYRSYVSISPLTPRPWRGMTVNQDDVFSTQIIKWPDGVEVITE